MKNSQRLLKLETAKRTTPQPITHGPGIVTVERIRRVFDEIKKREAECGPLPPFNWNEPSDHPLIERIRLRVLSERNAKTL